MITPEEVVEETVATEEKKKQEKKPVKCPECNGVGLKVISIPSRSFYHTIEYTQREDICHACKGSGNRG